MPGSPRPFHFFRYLGHRHEVHLATFASCAARYDTFSAHSEVQTLFKSITLLPTPQTVSFWGKQLHRLTQAPYFLTRFRSPEDFRLTQRRILELAHEKNADLLFADLLPAAQYLLDVKLLPRVVDATDALCLSLRRAAGHAGSQTMKVRLIMEAWSVRRFEMHTAKEVNAYIVCSEVDRGVLKGYDETIDVSCIPNGVDTQYFAPQVGLTDENAIVFTGVMASPPNADAARFFCTEVFPRVQAVIPKAKVLLVGSDPPEDVRALARNGVTVTGTVPDVRPYVHHASVCVSPLRFGAGMKNKILAALAMEKAVVATPESCEGLAVTPGEHLLVAKDAEGFARHVVELLRNSERRKQLGAAGRSLVMHRYDWAASGKQLESLLETLVSQRRNSPTMQHRLTMSA